MANSKRIGPFKESKITDRIEKAELLDFLNKYENMVEGRGNIGARNPLVLANQKLGLLDLDSLHGRDNLEHLLKDAFGDSLKYEEMFDPRFGSPVYFGLHRATAQLAKSSGGRYAEFLKGLHKDPPTGPGALPAECQNLVKSPSQSSVIGGNQTQYRDTDGRANDGLEFDDPSQGCVADCWFLSALSSVALMETVVNPQTKRLAREPPVAVYPPSTWPNPGTLDTSDAYYTTQNETRPYFGHMNPNRVKSTFYESWVAFYEKCFAGYYQNNRIPPAQPNNNPAYGSLNYKSSFCALAELTGRIVSTATSGYTKDYFGLNGNPDNNAGIIEKIRSTACNSQALDPNGVILYTKKPAVAYTYMSASSPAYVPAEANRNTAPYLYGAKVAYNCAGMPANHAFSIIGLFQKTGTQYVVLRNPWGFGGDSASFSTVLRNSLAPLPASLDDYDIDNTGAAGIFGLKSLTFMRYFEAFGCTIAI